ncbi:transcriptional regulator [Rhizobium rhizosphaerae]|uniref:Transcriptional regulator n=1 Tax=Xaviernesmea rhizosphaerae TaxID=1672749 RepID=A0A1Q9ALH9_9HYPH|nr:LysR substrate-binding domain-containing protein [Xaviernesmea rhizosphaerae]OLP56194.1 transcriptional regulator [Xaviernesmea rhizosphaerae]
MLAHIPLEAFRVFDAACRHMNFSRAGRELNVTQAAVSRRIKALEEHLGAALFHRSGKNLTLTPEGDHLFRRIRATLDYLEESLEPFRPQTGGTIALAASGSVSHLWLGRRLRSFSAQHPGISLSLLTTDALPELAAESHDLVILYSTGDHPRWALTPLVPEVLAPVAAPAYLQRLGIAAPQRLSADEIARLDLIDYSRANAHWISFRQWFARLKTPPHAPPGRARVSFSLYSLAIEAALDGDGVALGSLGLIGDLVGEGRLVVLGRDLLETGYGYHLGLPRSRASTPEALRLHAHLIGATGIQPPDLPAAPPEATQPGERPR